MPENELIPNDAAVETAQVETPKEKFERERLSRRQALKKLGITSAMATFALFSVDDLARMVGKAMEQRARDNKVVEQVAKEFQHAGIALADGTSGVTCQHCCDQLTADDAYCRTLPESQQHNCFCVKSQYFTACTKAHCDPYGESCTAHNVVFCAYVSG